MAIGSEEGKAEYVRSLVTRWCDQIHVLSEFAKLQPQAAHAAFVSGFCHRFTYYIRTIPEFETEMQQINNVIHTKLLPALLDHHSLSRHERELLSVPTRPGGLGIPIFSNISFEENVNSKTIPQATLFSRTTHQPQEVGIASKISEEFCALHRPSSIVRTKIAFTLLRVQVLCVRGSRAWQKSTHITSTSYIPLSEWNSTLN